MSETSLPEISQLSIDSPAILKAGEVHLYLIKIDELLQRQTELAGYISAGEEQRAGRFLNPQHGDQHRCTRGQLRKLLAHYLSEEPAAIEFEYAEHGKPGLRQGSQLYFNLSHSRNRVVFAFTHAGDIGVDVEYMRQQKNMPGMIRHVACEEEQKELAELAEQEIYPAFYRLWTRKEAVIKAVGRGLGMGLRSIYVGTAEKNGYQPVRYRNELMQGWHISDIDPPENYRLALCINTPG